MLQSSVHAITKKFYLKIKKISVKCQTDCIATNNKTAEEIYKSRGLHKRGLITTPNKEL